MGTDSLTHFPSTSEQPCSIHRYHSPKPSHSEQHYLLPRAWQRHWRPESMAAELWAPRTVLICPTGHRVVHLLIDELMHAIAKVKTVELAEAEVGRTRSRLSEWPVALAALSTWEAYNGSFTDLVEAGLWGQA